MATRADIFELVLAGLKSAANLWQKNANGSWPDEAPEYWFTTNVALHIHKMLGNGVSVGLERTVKTVLSNSGRRRRGRPKSELRSNGRCDIVVARANNKPFAAIEVKSPVYSFVRAVKHDIMRLCAMLEKSKTNSISIACLAVYSSASEKETRKGAKNELEHRFKTYIDHTKKLCSGRGIFAGEDHRFGKADRSGDRWGVQCIWLTRS